MHGLSFLEIITIITAIQLLLLGIVLIARKAGKRQSHLILAAFMFANALLLIYFLISLLDLFNMPSISVFYYLLGPLIYLYVLSLCEKNFSLNIKHWFHVLLFIAIVLFLIFKPLLTNGQPSKQWNYNEYLLSQIILHLQIATYIIASFYKIYLYRKDIKNHFSTIEQINLNWLLIIIVAFAAMWLMDFTSFIITIMGKAGSGTIYYLLISSIAINLLFANYMVYRGLKQPDAFSGIKPAGKYASSNISNEKENDLAKQLKLLMQNKKPFLSADLTIKDLSEQLNTHQKYLSQVINNQFHQNFFDFINGYRIEEAKVIISKNEDDKMTILEILFEVGFNSKSAFNNAFKKHTGKTPTEFKSSVIS